MTHTHDTVPPEPSRANRRRAVNLTVSADLLAEARALDIPLSATLEEALRAKIVVAREAGWLAENREAVTEYNERVAAEGTFGSQFGNI